MNDKEYLLRMDSKLFAQLKKYSKHNDLSIAQTSRKALKRFFEEQALLDQQKQVLNLNK